MSDETATEFTPEEIALTPGECLSQAREKYGLSVEDVAAELNLSVSQIYALEENRFGDLPGKTYTLGYMKAYARLVGCDEDDLFQNLTLQEDITIRSIRPVIPQPRRGNWRKKLFSLVALIIMGGLMFVWWQYREETDVVPLEAGNTQQPDIELMGQDSARSRAGPGSPATNLSLMKDSGTSDESAITENQEAGGVGVATGSSSDSRTIEEQLQAQIAAEIHAQTQGQSQESPRSDPQHRTEDTNTVAAAAGVAAVEQSRDGLTTPVENTDSVPEPGGGREIKLEFSASSWVDLRDADGKRLLYENINQGRQVTVDGKPPFSVFLGNAGGVQIEYEGKPFDFSAFHNGVYARFELGTQYRNQP